jgi:hypothetical protein
MEDRLQEFGLQLAEDKTQCIAFGRYARRDAQKKDRKPQEFTFLGFTHYCGKTRKGYFKLKRRTSHKKFGLSLNKFAHWARVSRSRLSKGQMLRIAKVRAVGHLNYYAITDNSDKCISYIYHATRTLFKWINRKSQRSSYTWEGFQEALRYIGWPKPSIRKDLNPCRCHHQGPQGSGFWPLLTGHYCTYIYPEKVKSGCIYSQTGVLFLTAHRS